MRRVSGKHIWTNTIAGVVALGVILTMGQAVRAEPGPAQPFQNKGVPPLTLEGRYVNLPAERSCRDRDGTSFCAYEIKGISQASDGEVYRHTIRGTSVGDIQDPQSQAQSRSLVLWEFRDGSSLLMESHGERSFDDNGDLRLHGTQTCLEGTGRFAQLDCQIDWANGQPRDDLMGDGLVEGVYSGTVMPKVSGLMQDPAQKEA